MHESFVFTQIMKYLLPSSVSPEDGYDIPKDTVIMYNIYGTHFDEDNFSEPHEFNPGEYRVACEIKTDI